MNVSITRILYAICAIAFVVVVARAYMNVRGPEALQPTLPQSDVQQFAQQQLDALQARSFADNQELCGIIFETSDGELGVSRPTSGEEATCDLSYFDEPGMVPVASFHTHGRHSREYDGEVPSITDIESDVASGIDGYVATPGGRFWWIEAETGIARLVCGPGCLTKDPNYRPCSGDVIGRSYTVEKLNQRFNSPGPDC